MWAVLGHTTMTYKFGDVQGAGRGSITVSAQPPPGPLLTVKFTSHDLRARES